MAISEVITGAREKPKPDALELEPGIHRLHSLTLALVSLEGTHVAGATPEDLRVAELGGCNQFMVGRWKQKKWLGTRRFGRR